MTEEEIRGISKRALFFLHYYTNTFKRVTIDSVLRQNSRLDKELLKLSKTLNNDQLLHYIHARSSGLTVVEETKRSYPEDDLDNFLLNDQEEHEYDSDYYKRID